MAKMVSKGDPSISIDFFASGWISYRNPLFSAFKGIGLSVVQFHDSVFIGANEENTDLFQWTRRPGFSKFCPIPLEPTEIVNQFYSNRDLDGDIVAVFDSNLRLAQFTDTTLTPIFEKSTAEQGFITQIGNFAFFSDGATDDFQMWDTVKPLSTINTSAWGLAAPTVLPTISNMGCWLPFAEHGAGNSAILDPNGNVEVVTAVYGSGPGMSGETEPLWPATTSSTSRDGNLQWTNDGPLLSWLPDTYYPVPVVILDTNGNLQLATTAVAAPDWNSGTAYAVGTTVAFGGDFFTATSPSTGIPPNTVATVGAVAGGQPYWVLTQNPTETGSYPTTPYTPTWNTAVGGTTVDGSYTWTNLGPGFLVESFGTSYVYCYRTIYGHLTTASQPSINTGSIFGPVVATVTGFSIAANVVTFIGTNNFIPGSMFTVQGLSVGTYLNNQSFTVLATGLSTTQFEADFTAAPVPFTVDQGTTADLIATVTGVGTNSPLCNAIADITAFNVVNSVVTLYAVSNFTPGLQVTITDLTVATFLNGLQFEIINVDPGGTWFQILFTSPLGVPLPNFGTTPDTGLATFNAIEIYRVSDGGGIYLFTGAVTNPAGSSTAYDSGFHIAGAGINASFGPASFHLWTAPGNVTSVGTYATVTLPSPAPAPSVGSKGLNATQFGFTVPPGTLISGVEISLEALFNGTPPSGVIQVQLLRSGIPTGAIMSALLTNADAVYTFGGAGSLWGIPWTPANLNLPQWGVQIVVSLDGGTTATFSVRNVNARVFGTTLTAPPWTFNDFTADINLDELQIAPQNHQNDPPPGAPGSSVTQTIGNITAYWNGRLWMVSGNYVYYTAGPDCTNGDPQSSWPPANRFQFAGPPLALIPAPDGAGLIVCLADRYNAILGGPETIAFYPSDALGNFGISNSNAIFKDGSTIGQFTTQSQYIDLVGGQKEDTGQHIADYLTENVSPDTAYVTMHRDGLDVGTFISNGVDRVLRFGNNISAWSVPAFPLGGAGALRSIETSVGTYSLMLASPTASPASYLLARDVNSWGDGGTLGANDGTPYPSCYVTIGSITLSQPGARLFPLQHVIGYFDAVGTLHDGGPSRPDIWLLMNEVSDTKGTGFVYLPPDGITFEPPQGQNQPSGSILQLRWNCSMINSQQASQFVHHLQCKIQFEPENAPKTIKAISFGEDQAT